MPYPGIPDSKTGKMDSCVQDVMDKEGVDEESAIKICRDSIMGFTIEIVQDPTEINAVLGGNYLPGELLRFENMELAKAEVNGNRDELTDEDITALADTLPLMPIDDIHKQDLVVGVFTAARNQESRLLTDGIIYARRFPGVAEDVLSGRKRPSVEAHADLAVCSLCGGEFVRAREYCDHLRDKHGSGATRRFKGIRSVGGGLVLDPAGSTAAFDLNAVYMVASHEEPVEQNEGVDMDKIEEIKAQLEEALKRVERLEADLAEAQDANETLQAEKEGLQSDVDAWKEKAEFVQNELEAMKDRTVELTEQSRRAVLADVYDEDQFDEHKDTIMAMSDDAVALLASFTPPKREAKPTQPVANLEDPPDDDVLTL